MKKVTILILTLVMALSASTAFAFGGGKKIKFMSKDIHTYTEILDGLDEKDKDVEVYGILKFPKNPDGHFKIPHLWPGQNPPPEISFYPWRESELSLQMFG